MCAQFVPLAVLLERYRSCTGDVLSNKPSSAGFARMRAGLFTHRRIVLEQ